MMSTPGGPPGPLPPGANDNRGPEIVAIVIAFPVLAAITVALRFYTRLRILKNASSDDLCIALALVCARNHKSCRRMLTISEVLTIAVSVCTCYEVKFGMGRHVYMLTLDDSVGQMKVIYHIL